MVMEAIAGAAASAALGSILGDSSSGSRTSQTSQSMANPFTAGGGLFSTTFGPGVQPNVGDVGVPEPIVPPAATPQRSLRDILRAGQLREGPQNFTMADAKRAFNSQDLGGMASGLLRVAEGSGGNQLGLNMSITDPQLQALSDMGLFQANSFFSQAGDNEAADLAGVLGLDFLGQVGSSNPMDVAQSQFNLLNPILQEQQMKDQLEMENRLFRQGRLGSSGTLSGQSDLNALFDSQLDAERQLLFDSLGQGMAVQAQNASLGATLSQLNPTLRGLFQGIGGNALNIPLGIQAAMLQQAQVAGGLSGAANTGTLTQPGLNIEDAFGAGLVNSGVQGLTNSIPGLFNSGSSIPVNAPTGTNPTHNGFLTTVGR